MNEVEERDRRLARAIAGALRAAIRDHGAITPEHIGSAVKRVIGSLRSAGVLLEIIDQKEEGPRG